MSQNLLQYYLSRLGDISGLPLSQGDKRKLRASLTQLTCSYAVNAKLLHAGKKNLRLLGRNLQFADWGSVRHLFEELFINRIYDVKMDLDSPFILDCGSNIGMSILFFKMRHPRAQIVGFEPDPGNFACLKNNIGTDLSDVTVHQKAVSDTEGIMTLFSGSEQGDSTTKTLFEEMLPTGLSSSHTVETVRLSTYISRKVDLLKLDVEGAEEAVLAELIASGKISMVQRMIIEYHDIHDTRRHSLSDFLATLTKEGYLYTLSAEPRFRADQLDVTLLQHVLVYATR